jgi:hypothetical protein
VADVLLISTNSEATLATLTIGVTGANGGLVAVHVTLDMDWFGQALIEDKLVDLRTVGRLPVSGTLHLALPRSNSPARPRRPRSRTETGCKCRPW